MHNHYVDRGIIKWAPFDALVGYHSMLQELKHKLGKKEKPLLSDDQMETMDRLFQTAIMSQQEIEIEYYRDGYTRVTFGMIKRIDHIHRIIVLSTLEKVNADDIIRLQVHEKDW
jgi:hypothetical protein